jgi:hypothetical protein
MPRHLLFIECFAEFETQLVDLLYDAGAEVVRFSLGRVRLFGRDLDLPAAPDRIRGAREGIRALVEIDGDSGRLIGQVRHRLARGGITVYAVEDHCLLSGGA